MATLIKSLYLSREGWGPNKGRLVGKLELVNEHGEFSLNISQEHVHSIVGLVAGAVVEAAKDVSQMMTAAVLEQVETPAIEG